MAKVATYDPTLFSVELAESVESRVGKMVLGHTHLGVTTSTYVAIPLASFSYSYNYNPNDVGTLIVGSESASVSVTFKSEPEVLPLFPSDRVRVRYDSRTIFVGTVDRTSTTRTPHGFGATVAFSASILGTYATMMTKQICFGDLPAEPAITRIRRWVTVLGWD